MDAGRAVLFFPSFSWLEMRKQHDDKFPPIFGNFLDFFLQERLSSTSSLSFSFSFSLSSSFLSLHFHSFSFFFSHLVLKNKNKTMGCRSAPIVAFIFLLLIGAVVGQLENGKLTLMNSDDTGQVFFEISSEDNILNALDLE